DGGDRDSGDRRVGPDDPEIGAPHGALAEEGRVLPEEQAAPGRPLRVRRHALGRRYWLRSRPLHLRRRQEPLRRPGPALEGHRGAAGIRAREGNLPIFVFGGYDYTDVR